VPAVPKSTFRRKRCNVRERVGHCLVGVPEAELSQAGSVNQDTAGRDHKEVPVDARVSTARIPGSHVPGCQMFLTE
jgi:hypothetical protein